MANQDNTASKKTPPPKGTSSSRKGGMDRRMKNKHTTFESNMYRKMEGKEIPDTRLPKKSEMPVSPAVLGLCLFLVVGSAFFQLLTTW
jgi:hypothetical protein